MKFLEKIRIQMIVLFLMEAIIVTMLFFLGWSGAAISAGLFFILSAIFVGWVVFTIEKGKEEQDIEISKVLEVKPKKPLNLVKLG